MRSYTLYFLTPGKCAMQKQKKWATGLLLPYTPMECQGKRVPETILTAYTANPVRRRAIISLIPLLLEACRTSHIEAMSDVAHTISVKSENIQTYLHLARRLCISTASAAGVASQKLTYPSSRLEATVWTIARFHSSKSCPTLLLISRSPSYPSPSHIHT